MPYYLIEALKSRNSAPNINPYGKIFMFGECEDRVIENVKTLSYVKGSHPDAIKSVTLIGEAEYLEGKCRRCKTDRKYFEILAKGGHVGNDKFFECHFFECAPDSQTASDWALRYGRIKDNHKDKCLGVEEISVVEFLEGIKNQDMNPYFHCKSRHGQDAITKYIEPYIKSETDKATKRRNIRKGLVSKDGKVEIGKNNPEKEAVIRYKNKKTKGKERFNNEI